MRLYRTDGRQLLLGKLEVATSARARSKGLLGHAPLSLNEGLWIKPSSWIHTFGMGFAIDVLYLGSDGRIVACSENLRPGRIDRPVLWARSVVEMAAGAIRHYDLRVGERVSAAE